ncbi:MAG TPA: RNB domain-containing ribonuclease [Solirubrobacterales bacterium]|nr:RNB domain-containing ribonuclease [Solirubrobacterales bacterium]
MPRARERSRFVAVASRRGRFLVAEPLFERGPQAALAGGPRVGDGEMALVELGPRGARVLAALGSAERARDVAAALIDERGLGRGFDQAVEEEARDAIAAARKGDRDRRDLRELDTFTVDPATARDFDDAVSAQPEGDGIRLWIHIADVAAHVRPGTRLDRDALHRGTSTYVPGTVEPMLPPALSDHACSLAPGAERLAVTAEIVVSAGGEPRAAGFYRSRVRSDARLTYDELDRFFAGRAEPPARIVEPLALARRAAAALAGRRPPGSLEVSSSEPEFEFDRDGDIVAARSVPQTEAHRLIEQLMIATNERVAEHCERRGVATIYRVHEQPDPPRIERLVAQLAAVGIPTPALPERFGPRQAGAIAAEASRLVAREAKRRGHGADAYTALVLRSLRHAYYSERNLGHAGLGSPAYAHFTSPIRRYPDLVAHRALLSTIGAGETEPERSAVADAAWRSSEREREAATVERAADKVCATFLLGRELFERGWSRAFEGEVSGVIGAGAFVRFAGDLADVYEGFMPARLLGREWFELNETETAIVGQRTGREIRLGDPVRVKVADLDRPRGRVDLQPDGAEPDGDGRRAVTRRRRERATRGSGGGR